MKKILLLLLLVVVAFLGLFGYLLGRPQAPGPVTVPVRRAIGPEPSLHASTSTLTVVTWNIAWGFGWGSEGKQEEGPKSKAQIQKSLEAMGETLKRANVDIALLQEVDFAAGRSHNLDQAEVIAQAAGLAYFAPIVSWRARYLPYPYWPPSGWWGPISSGAAILSRFPIETASGVLFEKPKSQPPWYSPFYPFRFLQTSDVRIGSLTLHVHNTHLEAFDPVNRMSQARAAAAILDRPGPFTLFGGDFNTVPPEAPVRHAFPDEPLTDFRADDTLAVFRAIPGLSHVVPADRLDDPSFFTFPSHAPNRMLDHMFVGPGLVPLDARVLTEAGKLSDHLPVIARFRIPL
ncbi:MAG: endonuclease/exonuclease/phosphatase family protein [Deltaproteobacteria bacterium]|nr:endonuclease/exonuclease/phosphatase family protein [Deltaproteobacteria bacterium]